MNPAIRKIAVLLVSIMAAMLAAAVPTAAVRGQVSANDHDTAPQPPQTAQADRAAALMLPR
ncbi:hypothetical protein [Catellatospora tritici]|uniref:hypothetical protein n=1 Tax=Catellatospora tritici TaxID=2851566 RepID=UPI001C2CF844|nr:hypothetical protein [Catellatospora tritici]MBV1855812.1 hypothetical protein [Catellatospora tritici]